MTIKEFSKNLVIRIDCNGFLNKTIFEVFQLELLKISICDLFLVVPLFLKCTFQYCV